MLDLAHEHDLLARDYSSIMSVGQSARASMTAAPFHPGGLETITSKNHVERQEGLQGRYGRQRL
jgi:hypothetical protein